MLIVSKFRLVPFLVIICILGSVHQKICAQNEITQRVEDVNIEAFDLSVALQKVARLYNTIIGFESSLGDKSTKQNIRLANATLQETLDFIITRSNPTYNWTISEGFVAVYPKEDRDPVLESLLATTLEDVSFDGEFTRIDIRDRLFDLPELKKEMEKNGVKPLNLEFFSAGTQEKFNLKLCEKKTTLRGILNKISVSRGSYFWIVSRYGKQNEFFIINF